MDHSSLGDRMKGYEAVSKNRLVRRMPVVLRLDGKAFHTFTRGFVKPFDDVMVKSMQDAMKYLCENIQGCVLGYTQSDEITLVLVDYEKLTTSAWFDNEVQKMCSVAASMATLAFNTAFYKHAESYGLPVRLAEIRGGSFSEEEKAISEQYDVYCKVYHKALFDCRAFNVPKEDVCNCVLWRQQDATRNSILAVAQSVFSHKEMQGQSCAKLQDMLHEQKGINWNDYPTTLKRGSCCIKKGESFVPPGQETAVTRMVWTIDNEIPIFTQDRDYIDKLIYIGE